MSKRKHETIDEELPSPERHRETKKQRTNSKILKAVPKHPETEGSAQVQVDRKKKKVARKLAKRERRAQERQQRNESGRRDGTKTGEHGGDTQMAGMQEKALLKEGRAESSKNRHGNRERGKKDRPKSREKHKSKKEKRKEKAIQPSGKKSKNESVENESVEMAKWKVSDPLGGQMLDVDPVFSPDEK